MGFIICLEQLSEMLLFAYLGQTQIFVQAILSYWCAVIAIVYEVAEVRIYLYSTRVACSVVQANVFVNKGIVCGSCAFAVNS